MRRARPLLLILLAAVFAAPAAASAQAPPPPGAPRADDRPRHQGRRDRRGRPHDRPGAAAPDRGRRAAAGAQHLGARRRPPLQADARAPAPPVRRAAHRQARLLRGSRPTAAGRRPAGHPLPARVGRALQPRRSPRTVYIAPRDATRPHHAAADPSPPLAHRPQPRREGAAGGDRGDAGQPRRAAQAAPGARGAQAQGHLGRPAGALSDDPHRRPRQLHAAAVQAPQARQDLRRSRSAWPASTRRPGSTTSRTRK